MVRIAEDIAGTDLEAMLYRGFIERGIARNLLARFYPDMTIERIVAMMPAICLALAGRDPDVRAMFCTVRYRHDFEAALSRAMKDELLQLGEAG